MLSKPEFPWEIIGFWVNEGPAALKRHGKIFLTYSASATDENYAMGMLTAAPKFSPGIRTVHRTSEFP